MKKIHFIFLSVLLLFSVTVFKPFQTSVLAQSVEENQVIGVARPILRPVIFGEDSIRVNRNIILNASSSTFRDPNLPVDYTWDMGDGTLLTGQEVVHTYKNPGRYKVTLTVRQEDQSISSTKEVVAYNKLIFLIAEATEWRKNILNLKKAVEEEGTYLFVLESDTNTTAFVSEENFYNKLSDQLTLLTNADEVAIWTNRGSAMNALSRLVQQNLEAGNAKLKNFLNDKTILVLTEENIGTLARIMQASYNIIEPKRIIVTRHYELRNFTASASGEAFLDNLKNSVSDYEVIDGQTSRVSVFNFMSYLVSFMISKGIPSNTIILLLMLPVIVTLIAIFKQVIGITTFGVYTPSIITLSFLALGLKVGLFIFFVIILSGAVLRKLLDRFHLLHIPRVAIILSISTLIILLILGLGTYLGVSSLATVAVFPMLIMTTLAERFVTALGGKGFYAALILMVETLFMTLVCYWVVEWQALQTLILGHPEIILLLIVFNYALGRWSGLRLLEYVRFREVMKHAEE